MAEPNPDHWALTHMRWLALSRRAGTLRIRLA